MHLVKDDPLYILDLLAVVVQHGLEHFRGHDQTRRILIKLHVSCDHADISKFELEVSILLVAQGLNGRGVDCLGHVSARESDCILCDYRLACGRVSCNEDVLARLESVHCTLLEVI